MKVTRRSFNITAWATTAVLFLCPALLPNLHADTLHTDTLPAVVAPHIAIPPTPVDDSIIVLNFRPVQNNGHALCLNEYISVKVKNLPLLYSQSGHASDNIVLYIDGVAMHGLNPVFENRTGDSLMFKLVRDSVTERSWEPFYEAPRTRSGHKMSLSIGYEHDRPVATRVRNFSMNFVDGNILLIAYAVILLIIAGCIILGMKTTILRDKVMPLPVDPNAPPANPPVKTIDPKKASFSLARTQILFWTVITAVSYIFIWAVTSDIPEITGSTLLLLTVSIGTSAGARAIDLSQENNPKRHQNGVSQGFFRDILSDENGISIHRVQMVIWMLIIGVYFLKCSYEYLYMPELGTTTLALMGISAGAYVGLKLPENKSGDGSSQAGS